jgi:hypothetical protein
LTFRRFIAIILIIDCSCFSYKAANSESLKTPRACL